MRPGEQKAKDVADCAVDLLSSRQKSPEEKDGIRTEPDCACDPRLLPFRHAITDRLPYASLRSRPEKVTTETGSGPPGPV